MLKALKQLSRLAARTAALAVPLALVACGGGSDNASLGASWAAWPSKMVFDATPAAKSIHAE